MRRNRRVCSICNKENCNGYGNGFHIPDHEPSYEDAYPPEINVPKCHICKKWVPIGDDKDYFYIVDTGYFSDIVEHDFRNEFIICIKCFNEKFEPILNPPEQLKKLKKNL